MESLSSLPQSAKVVRIVRLRVRPDAEIAFFSTLRRVIMVGAHTSPGLISLTVAREISSGRTDALIIGVWASFEQMQAAAQGQLNRPMFPDELMQLIQSSSVDHFEVALYWDRMGLPPPVATRPGKARRPKL